MASLTFHDLRNPKDRTTTTLAYWLTLTRAWRIDEATRDQLKNAMSYQYDIEEQMECTGWAELLSSDPRWQRRLRPIAPVQLALEWSPCPLAETLLGAPCSQSISTDGLPGRRVAMVWHRRQLERIQRLSHASHAPDEQRFVELLGDAVLLARMHGCGILLVAQPGWDYKRARPMKLNIAQSMIRCGYLQTDRHP
jgi:hypothetical protein